MYPTRRIFFAKSLNCLLALQRKLEHATATAWITRWKLFNRITRNYIKICWNIRTYCFFSSSCLSIAYVGQKINLFQNVELIPKWLNAESEREHLRCRTVDVLWKCNFCEILQHLRAIFQIISSWHFYNKSVFWRENLAWMQKISKLFGILRNTLNIKKIHIDTSKVLI